METSKEVPLPSFKKVLKNPGGYAHAMLVVVLAFKRVYGQALKEAAAHAREKNNSNGTK